MRACLHLIVQRQNKFALCGRWTARSTRPETDPMLP